MFAHLLPSHPPQSLYAMYQCYFYGKDLECNTDSCWLAERLLTSKGFVLGGLFFVFACGVLLLSEQITVGFGMVWVFQKPRLPQ